MVKDYPTPTPKKKKKKKKKVGSLPAPQSGYATTIIMFYFAHLLILEYPDHHQNLISSSLYYPRSHPKISSQSVHNFLSNVVHKQTNQHHQKHNLLCQGGNKFGIVKYILCYEMRTNVYFCIVIINPYNELRTNVKIPAAKDEPK